MAGAVAVERAEQPTGRVGVEITAAPIMREIVTRRLPDGVVLSKETLHGAVASMGALLGVYQEIILSKPVCKVTFHRAHKKVRLVIEESFAPVEADAA